MRLFGSFIGGFFGVGGSFRSFGAKRIEWLALELELAALLNARVLGRETLVCSRDLFTANNRMLCGSIRRRGRGVAWEGITSTPC